MYLCQKLFIREEDRLNTTNTIEGVFKKINYLPELDSKSLYSYHDLKYEWNDFSEDYHVDYLCYRDDDIKNFPKRQKNKIFTVVLDLDETLTDARDEIYLFKRPYVQEFLEIINREEEIEVILWSAGGEEHVRKCLYFLDPAKKYFSHIIHDHENWKRRSTVHLKNLCFLGESRKDSSILIDNSPLASILNGWSSLIVPDFTMLDFNHFHDKTLIYVLNIIIRIFECLKEDNSKLPVSYYLVSSPLCEKAETKIKIKHLKPYFDCFYRESFSEYHLNNNYAEYNEDLYFNFECVRLCRNFFKISKNIENLKNGEKTKMLEEIKNSGFSFLLKTDTTKKEIINFLF